jgi:hypothetical protein
MFKINYLKEYVSYWTEQDLVLYLTGQASSYIIIVCPSIRFLVTSLVSSDYPSLVSSNFFDITYMFYIYILMNAYENLFEGSII